MAGSCWAEVASRPAEKQPARPQKPIRSLSRGIVAARGRPAERAAGGGPAPPAAPAAAPPAPMPGPAAPAAAPATPVAAPPAAAPPAAPALGWDMVKTHTWDALWFFGGEHPSGFSTTVTLRARGFTNPAALAWKIAAGAGRVAFAAPPSGSEVRVRSTAGSVRANDVSIDVREGTGAGAPTFTGHMSVLKPHRLLRRGLPHDIPGSPPWAPAPPGVPGYWTVIGYRVVDNLGGTVVGATVNEHFPSAKVNDQPNNWTSPAAFATVPFWENTNGTFPDNWFQWGGHPAPVAPTAANAGQPVDHMDHQFYVGSKTPAKGLIVQKHVAHRYLGRARHEGIISPVP
jgi:hypothetical protein